MSHKRYILPDMTSTRRFPVNICANDVRLFEHELEKMIPATFLTVHRDLMVSPGGILFRRTAVLPESFPVGRFDDFMSAKSRLSFLLRNSLFGRQPLCENDAVWVTDSWSNEYFHWITDALPRLLALSEMLTDPVLLLPGAYESIDYVVKSLTPFHLARVTFVRETCRCKHLSITSHTAPTGNYNDGLIMRLRDLFRAHFGANDGNNYPSRVYISRGKALRRWISNEDECRRVLRDYGFTTIHFEEHTFDEQVRIAMNAECMVSNHGAGLTNMLFMGEKGRVLELRRSGDAKNNCYFSLASALDLHYYYQLCESDTPGADTFTGNLIVDCDRLRANLELITRHE
jgi:hypothetical protein